MNKKGVTLAISIIEFVGLLVFVGAIVLIVRMLLGNVVKIEIEKEKFAEAGKAINFAHVAINSPDLASFDESMQPRKGVINKTKIKELSTKKELLNCCSYIEYDYYIEIVTDKTNENYYIGYPIKHLNELLKAGKSCGEKIQDLRKYKIPVVIDEDMETASMYITLTKTPLSKIATELLVACKENEYENQINSYGFYKENFYIRKNGEFYEICLTTFNNINICNKITCEKQIIKRVFINKCNDVDDKCIKGCSYFFDKECRKNFCTPMKIKSTSNEVILCFAETEKDLEQC